MQTAVMQTQKPIKFQRRLHIQHASEISTCWLCHSSVIAISLYPPCKSCSTDRTYKRCRQSIVCTFVFRKVQIARGGDVPGVNPNIDMIQITPWLSERSFKPNGLQYKSEQILRYLLVLLVSALSFQRATRNACKRRTECYRQLDRV